MSVIVYELNEVPRRLFDFYSDAFPDSAFSVLRARSNLFETVAADVGVLSPWITWPTMHRGVSNIDHEISELGQTLDKVNFDFPSVHNICAERGIKVGVFGSLQSYPLPKKLENYSFYVPDTFAAGDECFPAELSDFQSFNLAMVRANGRNVQAGLAIRKAANFLKKSIRLGVTPRTFRNLASQILMERVDSGRLVRRRTSQIEIAFDLFLKQLAATKPDVSFFFTNHVASSMHRYWPTVFPQDYEEGKFEDSWLRKWAGEIPHAVRVADYQLRKLIDYCDKFDTELIVCSSMGQAAVKSVEPLNSQVLITNVNKLMSYIGFSPDLWRPKLAMAPRVVVTPTSFVCISMFERLSQIKINGSPINVHYTNSGDVRLDVSLANQASINILDGEKVVDPHAIGIENVSLQDASGSYAYHIPEGVMLHYKPAFTKKLSSQDAWKTVSVLDFAPSLLSKFSISPPSYMGREHLFGRI